MSATHSRTPVPANMKRVEALHIFILFSLGVAQPLFQLLGSDVEFFIVRRSKPVDLWLLVLILCAISPGILALLKVTANRLSRRLGEVFYAFVLVVLVAVIVLPGLNRIEDLPGTAIFIVALFISAGVVAGYWRYPAMRTFVSFLSPALIVVPALFLFNPSVSKVLSSKEGLVPSAKINATAPVVMLVLDELPVTSLMNKERTIDPVRYPNFARLLNDFTWFRNATTVSDSTTHGVPPILTGTYPGETLHPTVADYPRNLFTLLGGSYQLKVFESSSQLCPKKTSMLENDEPFVPRIRALMLDLTAVYLHMVLPGNLTRPLPVVTQNWGNFWAGGKLQEERQKQGPFKDRAELFSQFLESIVHTGKPALYYLHIMLPHVPWQYLPSGKAYNYYVFGYFGVDGLTRKEQWGSDELAITRGFQRHLLQVGFVDMMVGKLMDRLKEVGLYDASLIVITADHGGTFRAGEPRRGVTGSNYQDILPVPLLIKAPHQSNGSVNDYNVETIDILPTMADILGIQLPWNVDGHSVWETAPKRDKKTVLESGKWQKLEFDAEINAKYETLNHMLALFHNGLFDIGPRRDLISKPVSDLHGGGSDPVTIRLNDAASYEQVDLNSTFLPAFITGTIVFKQQSSQRLTLAIAVNGICRAVTLSFPLTKDEDGFAAMVPESAFHQGKNEVRVFEVSRRGSAFAEGSNMTPLADERCNKAQPQPRI